MSFRLERLKSVSGFSTLCNFDMSSGHNEKEETSSGVPVVAAPGEKKSVPLHVQSVDEFHRYHDTNDYRQYLASGSELVFFTWYSQQVDGVVTSTCAIAAANGWEFDPVMYQEGHDGRVVRWNARTNELYVKMTTPSASAKEFSTHDLKLVLRAVLTTSADPEDKGVMSVDQIMNEVGDARPEGILRLIRDLTMP